MDLEFLHMKSVQDIHIEHDENLAIRICSEQRPKSNYKISQLILDIIN